MDRAVRLPVLDARRSKHLCAGGIGLVAPSTESGNQSAADQHLAALLAAVDSALQRDDLERAVRYADRAGRLASADPTIAALRGRLLVLSGEPMAAAALLAAAAELQPAAETAAWLSEALLAAGRVEDGVQQLAAALRSFAVAGRSPLARLAHRLLAMPEVALGGWVGIAPRLELAGEVRIDRSASSPEITVEGGSFVLRRRTASCGDRAPFRIALPREAVHETLAVHVDGAPLLGSGLRFPPEFALDGRAAFGAGRVAGWACLGWAPSLLSELVIDSDLTEPIGVSVEIDPADSRRRRFAFEPRALGLGGNRLVISARLPNGDLQQLPDAPLLLETPACSVLPAAQGSRRGRQRPPVSIVIPVFRGREETLACLESILATTTGRVAKVVIIDDASPDAELREGVASLAAHPSLTLVRNAENLGFPATANRGFAARPEDDIVVLNADATVHGNWLERLRQIAYAMPDTGTVTPLSNEGTIASYPARGGACSAAEAATIDRLAASLEPVETVALPTGVGFCMYFRRDCLADVGYFDADTFGQGYGEENDFCMRAAQRGWRHVLAPNVFVRHSGGRSFGRRRAALMERNRRLLNLRHPTYDALVAAFIAADPVHAVRRRLDEARLIAVGREHVLILTLAADGGIARFVAERARTLEAEGTAALLLKPAMQQPPSCEISVDGGAFGDLRYRLPDDLAALRRLLERLRLRHLELHHFLGHDGSLIDSLLTLGVPYDIYIHDNGWVCPRLNLIGGDGRYCGEPDLPACEKCVEVYGSRLGESLSTAELRRRSERWLAGARQVLVPSGDTARRLARHFPRLAQWIVPWEADIRPPSPPPTPPRSVKRIAVIGAIGQHKGFDVLLDCARDAAARALPLEFVVIGYTEDDEALLNTGKAFVTGEYQEREISDLLHREAPNIAFFPSITPESWCYTLSHALRAGLPILAFDIGAIAERLQTFKLGKVVPMTTDPAYLNDLLLAEPQPALPSGEASGRFSATSDTDPSIEMATAHPSASVQVVTVAEGLYAFRVRSGSPERTTGPEGLLLPAVGVGTVPGQPADALEFLAGPGTDGNWLHSPGQTIVARVARQPATVLLTSLRGADGPPLSIVIDRLDQPNQAIIEAAPRMKLPAQPPAVDLSALEPSTARAAANGADGSTAATAPGLRTDIVVHIQRRGNSRFSDASWAGYIGQRLWIEAFGITPLEEIAADRLEYKGLTAAGYETPWRSDGALCGSTGMAMPLIGFAVRCRPADGAAAYDCEYSGAFLSGAIIGPRRNGAPCFSAPDDALEAIRLQITRCVPGEKIAGASAKPRRRRSGRAAEARNGIGARSTAE